MRSTADIIRNDIMKCSSGIPATYFEKGVKLNLGSGMKKFHLKGFCNVDTLDDADVTLDLSSGSWLWDDNTVAEIRADNLLEHFDNDDFLHVMNEAHRVLSPKGTFWFRVPDAEKWPDGAWGDPTHKRYFFPRSFYYFDVLRDQWKNYGKGYGFEPWQVHLNRTHHGKFFEAILRPVK